MIDFLPTLSYFEHKNIWTGSQGCMNYRIEPSEQILKAEAWPGPWCYALSEVECAAEFPMTNEGIEAVRSWLVEKGEDINSRPAPTPEELNAQFAAIRAKSIQEPTAKGQ